MACFHIVHVKCTVFIARGVIGEGSPAKDKPIELKKIILHIRKFKKINKGHFLFSSE